MPDGSRFGPGTIDNLNEWIREGRLLPGTTIQNGTTGELRLAQDVAGLVWNRHLTQAAPPLPYSGGSTQATPRSQPSGWGGPAVQSPYVRTPVGNPDNGDKEAKLSLGASIGSLLLCCCPVVALFAIKLGYTARSKGSYMAGSAIGFAWLVTIVTVAYWLLSMGALQAVGK